MARDIEVTGLADLARLSRSLREAGEQGKGLKRELSRGITRETKQTRKDMRAAIVPGLPKRGGLAGDVLKSTRFTASTSVKSGDVGVRIIARGKRSIRRMNDQGVVRHPVFGRRNAWVSQTKGVHLGFLARPFQQSRPALQRAVILAIARVRSKIL